MNKNVLILLSILAVALLALACGDDNKNDAGSDGDTQNEDGDTGDFLGSCSFTDDEMNACANYSNTESLITAQWAEDACTENYTGTWSTEACPEASTNGSCSYLNASGFTWELFYYGMDAAQAQTICAAGMGTWNE